MKRDFSDASKQKMLGLVAQVESEKWGNFTDWVGDRWYDFESWIGVLGIKNYINNVNAYHKKVIDKNNATEQTINKIFTAVRGVDSTYGVTFGNIRTNLSQWLRYIDQLSEIVEPGKGRFDGEYMRSSLDGMLDKIEETQANLPAPNEAEEDGIIKTFIDEFCSNYGWSDVLSGAGYIGKIYDFIQDIKDNVTLRDHLKSGVSIYQFFQGAVKTFKNYWKIGNAVGAKTAMTWWAKNITGLKPLGRASSAKNIVTRFANNLTNKTSPFNTQIRNVVDDFTGANGAGKAVASWGSVAVNGVLNWMSNKDEQAASNGSMSDGRVVAETITETVVDTALTYGAGIVVGAAVTAVAGTVAAPGILVVAASGALVAGVNAGVKAITGKTTTEWVSDTILDAGAAIGSAAKKAAATVGKWFAKL